MRHGKWSFVKEIGQLQADQCVDVKDLDNSLHHKLEEEVRLPIDEYEGTERLEEKEIAFIFDQDL